ncbi:nucleotide-binding universal stress UspA family protein [Streptomyces aurantiacus]|uniref:universal stress protein n=1 Tax=Streptomyces aurantiacus TaxID=47760 RepID=UPI0027931DCD|nr:universal stress protein [Streptomyces aurantiacus]MDQ0779927.1 nucleotide-binding universal stress UspA family protein [Streptomyces aurantiacus]
MLRPITVGLDGSPESLAAADWAAREAQRRGLPLHLVNASVWQPHDVPAAEDLKTQQHWALRVLRECEEDLLARYPQLTIDTEQVSEPATDVLLGQAEKAEMLVLGSSGHGAIAGFLLGSVGQHVLAKAKHPVVMVRANTRSAAEGDTGEVMVGLQELGTRAGPLLEFAFRAAAARGATLRAVHAWEPPPLYGRGPEAGREAVEPGGLAEQQEKALSDTLQPWRETYPQVTVVETIDRGAASGVVLQAAAHTGLVVVGRRVHRPAPGMRIGPVAHAVLHHAAAPVVIVPHD